MCLGGSIPCCPGMGRKSECTNNDPMVSSDPKEYHCSLMLDAAPMNVSVGLQFCGNFIHK